jgi:V8-like Glu-specific endopeptidase
MFGMSKFNLYLSATVFVMSPVQACNPVGSKVNIDSGIYLDQTSENSAVGVVPLGNCSATIVSTNTLVTAAHCVSAETSDPTTGKTQAKVCLVVQRYSGLCSSAVYVPTKYMQAGVKNFGYDVAVAVFDGNPFKFFHKVQTQTISQQTNPSTLDITLVGYSSVAPTESGRGSKRWGRNTLNELNSFELDSFVTYYGGGSNNVAVSPGDSGGPIFNKCQLIGVASRRGSNYSLHTNITAAPNQDFMKSVEKFGASYCSDATAGTDICPTAGLIVPVTNPPREKDGSEGFPCAPGLGNGGGSTPSDNGDIFLYVRKDPGSNDPLAINAYIGSMSNQLAVCINKPVEQCLTEEVALQKSTKLSTGRYVSKINIPIKADRSTQFTIVDLAQKKSRVVRFATP